MAIGFKSPLLINGKRLFPMPSGYRDGPIKPKEKKCLECGSMPWRVEGDKCKACGLQAGEEEIEQQSVYLKSSMGDFEDKF
jgi:hypothetical protein